MDIKVLDNGQVEVTEYTERKQRMTPGTLLTKLNADIRALKSQKTTINDMLEKKRAVRAALRKDKKAAIALKKEWLPIIWNVTADGKIYHLATDPTYDDVDYDEARGDLTFTTEDEAKEAGFKRVKI